jgi:hypothetical protein
MKKLISKVAIGLALAALVMVPLARQVTAHNAGLDGGVDRLEVAVTNYIATVTAGNDTNTTTLVLPALSSGAGYYTYIKVTPATNVCMAFGRAATTNDPQVTTAGWSWTLPANSLNDGGPYRNTAIYLRDTRGATNLTTTATIEAWKVVK